MSLYSVAYISHSRLDDLVLDTRVEIEKILQVAQRRNAASDVTGALMFNDRMFTQVLEGDEGAVHAIFSSIERDARHRDIAVLETGNIVRRSFPVWSMAYAGTSEVAKVYYKDYMADQSDWQNMTRPRVCELMLRMISLDQWPRSAWVRKSPSARHDG